MSYRQGRDAVDGYVWLEDPSIVLSGGPSHARSADDDDEPYEPPRQRLGFAPPAALMASDYRRIEPGACPWCGHQPHDAACPRTIRTRNPMPHGPDATVPCPCARRNR